AVQQSLPSSRCVPTAEGAPLACVSRMLRGCASPNTSTCLPSCGSSLVHCGSSLPSSWLCLLPSSLYRWRCITPRESRLCLRREFSLFFACFSWSWPPFVTGWSLLKLQPWGRTFALVMAFTALIHPPLGTALGVYTLFVLLPDAAGDEYRQMSQTNS